VFADQPLGARDSVVFVAVLAVCERTFVGRVSEKTSKHDDVPLFLSPEPLLSIQDLGDLFTALSPLGVKVKREANRFHGVGRTWGQRNPVCVDARHDIPSLT